MGLCFIIALVSICEKYAHIFSVQVKDVKWTNTVQLAYWSAGLGWIECWYCHHQQSEKEPKHRTQDRTPEFLPQSSMIIIDNIRIITGLP